MPKHFHCHNREVVLGDSISLTSVCLTFLERNHRFSFEMLVFTAACKVSQFVVLSTKWKTVLQRPPNHSSAVAVVVPVVEVDTA